VSGNPSDATRIDHAVTSGTFSLDGGTWDVDNNVWVIGTDTDCVVIDAPHRVDTILEVIGRRRVHAILATHAHDDHIRVARELAQDVDAPIMLHPADRVLWDEIFPGHPPDKELEDGDQIRIGEATLRVLHTPGHSPGSCCFYAPTPGLVFTGDTLFSGGPGATGRSYSSFEKIIDSISTRLLTLPEETIVRPGHGDSTTIGAEAPYLQDWIDRGH
jgi:glyoxylase-like metal-dependent hydrolase (beta-lactamase superfamily II)